MTPAVAPLTHDLAPIREIVRDRPVVPVLIRVPALRPATQRRVRRRRRLRREVRLGGMALLFGAPLLALGAMLPGTGPPTASLPAAPAPEAGGAAPPQVSLLPTLEPVPAPSSPDPPASAPDDEHWVDAWAGDLPPVRTSGYLLPGLPALEDGDGPEEAPHAGS